jgi:5-(carboxyamino)imidazole ribonucleotide synthase
MVNLIGQEKPVLTDLSANTQLHWYDKVVRPGRKLGHINVTAENNKKLAQEVSRIEKWV